MGLAGMEEAVRRVVDPALLDYNDSWDKVDAMLARVMDPAFRLRDPDSRGRGWVYNWCCVDHVRYDVNPRRRDIGFHNVFDHYAALLRRAGASGDPGPDGLHFHFHPHPMVDHAHLCATHWWAASDKLYQVLSRRIVDRLWFPSVNRPGFQVNRPDSHWFLEQFVPFDFASLAVDVAGDEGGQFDLADGRSGDWRRAPCTWEPYHPSHDDYQVPGSCRRWIARALNMGTRFRCLDMAEVRRAFAEARQGRPVVMAFADHDFRDIRPNVEAVRGWLNAARQEFPDVEVRHCEAVEAMRSALALPAMEPCSLDLDLIAHGDAHVLTVRTDTPSFGPQPYLALKTVTRDYRHDNLDFQVPGREWTYVFDAETMPLRALEAVGVACCNARGAATVAVLDADKGTVRRRVLWGEA